MPKKLTYEYVKSYIESYDYQLLSTEYKGNNKNIEVKCPKGHSYITKFNYFQQGYKCPYCAGNIKYTYEYVKNYFEKEGYELLSNNYKNNRKNLCLKCPEGHTFEMRYSDFYRGNRCPICNYTSMSSKAEKEIQQYIREMHDGVLIPNDRKTIINPLTGYYLELDAYLPELNAAIEYNGIYWHSDKYQQTKDKIKKDQCQKLGIDLLVINDCEWKWNKKDCLEKITNFVFH